MGGHRERIPAVDGFVVLKRKTDLKGGGVTSCPTSHP